MTMREGGRDILQLTEDWEGYQEVGGRRNSPDYLRRLKETIDILTNARDLAPHRARYLLQEAITTSDFPLLFGDVIDRQVLAQYKAVDPVWKLFSKQSTNNDFRTSHRYRITGGDQKLDLVPEKGEYQASDRNEERFAMLLLKYGRQFDISWESLVNDDLNVLKDTPSRFARAAIRTEHRLLTNLYADDDGTHAAGNLYDKTTANQINGSTALMTIANLEAGITRMGEFLDADGEPIANRAKFLVVPPALELTSRAILTSATKMWVESAGGAATAFPTTNVVPQMGLTLVVDPYLPVMDPTNGDTAWYLFSDPADIAALEAAHLRGHERPEIVMKASNKVAIGGGPVGPLDGDFETDNVLYRVRLVFGVTKLDWRATYAGGLVS